MFIKYFIIIKRIKFIFFITRFSTITIIQDFVKDLQVYKANIFKLYYYINLLYKYKLNTNNELNLSLKLIYLLYKYILDMSIAKSNNTKSILKSLPKKNIKKGDPYQWQVEQSVKKIVENLNDENLDWILSYQSRVGPLKWIGPSTETIIIENSKIGKHIVLVPIAFVSEHSETLVELDIEYKEIADANGCKNYTRVPALGINEDFIKAMSELVIKKNEYKFNDGLYPPKIQCPLEFKKCPCLNHE